MINKNRGHDDDDHYGRPCPSCYHNQHNECTGKRSLMDGCPAEACKCEFECGRELDREERVFVRKLMRAVR